MLDLKQFISYYVRELQYPPMFCDITQCARKALMGTTHQCFAGKKLKNLNFSASGIYRIYILISYYYYVRGLQYMPPRVLALWGQNPAGAIIYVCFPERLAYDLLGSTPLATERLVWWKRRSAEYGIGVRRTEQEYRVCQKIVYFAYKDSILTRLRVFHFMPP
jgi:hypothetical protein